MPRTGLVCLVVSIAFVYPQSSSADESWDAIYLGPSKVGSMHVQVKPVRDAKGRELVNVRVDWTLTFKRGRDSATTELLYGTIETPEGQVLRLDTRTKASRNTIRTYGDVIDGKMTLTIEAGGQTQRKQIEWGPDVRGPYGAEMTLARKPIQPGETREVKTYIPDLNQVCVTKLVAKAKEPVQLGQGPKRDLMRVEQSILDATGKPLPGMVSTLWVDEGGQILKSSTELMGKLVTYRTTKEGATAPNGEVNLFEKVVRVPRKIVNAESRREIVYRVGMKDDKIAEVLPADRRQSLQPGGSADAATFVVRTAGPDEGEAGSDSVDDQYLRPNALVDSGDPRVVELARRAVGNQVDPWAKARAIVEFVHTNVRNKNFQTAFAPAGEVARDLSGDCTEHSVLTAAMCRAVGVPSRCVVGLVYADQLGGFGFHMWNEVYVNRRWVAIDSAFDQTEVDATHLKLSETSLDGVAPFEALLPVIRVADKMTIEPVEVR